MEASGWYRGDVGNGQPLPHRNGAQRAEFHRDGRHLRRGYQVAVVVNGGIGAYRMLHHRRQIEEGAEGWMISCAVSLRVRGFWR